jgi:hypothetical protein
MVTFTPALPQGRLDSAQLLLLCRLAPCHVLILVLRLVDLRLENILNTVSNIERTFTSTRRT